MGNGTSGNIGAEAITHLAGETLLTNEDWIDSVTNPMPAAGGVDPETLEQVRQYAPQAFRTQKRAVTPEDYATMAEKHSEVQRAAATLRWTGSWHTVFLTIDRVDGGEIDAAFENELREYLEQYRMAGQDLEIDGPQYVALELEMMVCVASDYFRSDVLAALQDVFSSGTRADGSLGFFNPDKFTFGQGVYLSQLYAAAQEVAGVRYVEINTFQRLGTPSTAALDEGVLTIGRLEIARLDNDPNFPERGVLDVRDERRKMNNPLDPTLRELDDCGCCAGITVETPVEIDNRPGLEAIVFRAGNQPQFKATMLAALSSAATPALRSLKTRENDDFTIALLDGWATVADVLTFYSERIANEGYLRTATERASVLELARSIGYELNPGVAASTYLAFTVEDAVGAPGYANIDAGTKVQSIPGPDETPQIIRDFGRSLRAQGLEQLGREINGVRHAVSWDGQALSQRDDDESERRRCLADRRR